MQILIIDDDPEEFDFFQMTVDAFPGIKYVPAECGEGAMTRILEHNFDVIILDMNLGALSGIECLRHLKEHPLSKNIPVVMFSSSKNLKEVNTCQQVGAKHFFIKPPSVSQLISIIRTLLEIDWKDNRETSMDNFILTNQGSFGTC